MTEGLILEFERKDRADSRCPSTPCPLTISIPSRALTTSRRRRKSPRLASHNVSREQHKRR
jgi:hypothetical protein